ncbi:M1 family aminopeptidase [Sediminibacterium goheungense]|uniref:Aminopeptidase N n=1 Tax=Sediminibacterium goheungense TaxID=1086393 RepID=A0A4R6J160_9BACT|nr:M1 family aminopeptidase [Sediminibacterium goheungense]TDO28557.1 aminopeptidase N [Sediminibacterium goheungense]
MKRLLLLLAFFPAILKAQTTGADDWKKVYRSFATKVNDVVHTRLDAKFDYDKSYLNGKVWITLEPHFYSTDSLQLDAKGMNIHQVAIVKAGKNIPLKYGYDSLFLNIQLDKSYKKGERYTVYIDYTAKPNEFKAAGSAAITDAKGLYFINPKGEEKDKPTQIWTQGETEATSVWVPTIDRPNQKSTQLFNLTVPKKYVSLSNGKLIAQKLNTDGTRTDTWSMDQPHAPYLFFMGIGDYAVVKDSYKGKEVSYYVEKEYEKVARKIFGDTPEMMAFFSKKLGVEYPWVKYSQMTARDYVSGAMENTTATLHQESAQQDARELVDGNGWESTIAHELFHQWFGDLVTAESWSNLTVNESFADYSQYLWAEYKHGKDEAMFENFNQMRGYIGSGQQARDLVRFYYKDKEDMFDAISYNKGGRILHMLRNLVGDDAFFASLNKYLTTHKFGNGNAHKLRLAFEEVTGKDLNWFFNQWYFGNGHPRIDISYQYNTEKQVASVIIKQIQAGDKIFRLPFTIDIWHGNEKKREMVWMENKADTFNFSVKSKPDQINVDADKYLLVDKKDNKNLAEFIHQFKHAGNYLDRREAVAFAGNNLKEPAAVQLLMDALNDPYFRIRSLAITNLAKVTPDDALIAKMESIAKNDPKRTVKAEAIDFLAKLKKESYSSLFMQATKDSSYTLAGAGLEALSEIDSAAALTLAKELSKSPSKGRLNEAISGIMITYGDETAFPIVSDSYEKMPLTFAKVQMSATYAAFAAKLTKMDEFTKAVDAIFAFRDMIPPSARAQTDPTILGALKSLATAKEAAGAKQMADYVRNKLPEEKK